MIKNDKFPAFLIKNTVQYSDYVVVSGSTKDELQEHVKHWNIEGGYECQGGVSVTNYRGLDGNIVMVYCQAMIRKE